MKLNKLQTRSAYPNDAKRKNYHSEVLLINQRGLEMAYCRVPEIWSTYAFSSDFSETNFRVQRKLISFVQTSSSNSNMRTSVLIVVALCLLGNYIADVIYLIYQFTRFYMIIKSIILYCQLIIQLLFEP